jgi:hypothetical protein
VIIASLVLLAFKIGILQQPPLEGVTEVEVVNCVNPDGHDFI